MCGLEVLELAEEPVVFGVRHLRRVRLVVALVRRLDLLGERRVACLGGSGLKRGGLATKVGSTGSPSVIAAEDTAGALIT